MLCSFSEFSSFLESLPKRWDKVAFIRALPRAITSRLNPSSWSLRFEYRILLLAARLEVLARPELVMEVWISIGKYNNTGIEWLYLEGWPNPISAVSELTSTPPSSRNQRLSSFHFPYLLGEELPKGRAKVQEKMDWSQEKTSFTLLPWQETSLSLSQRGQTKFIRSICLSPATIYNLTGLGYFINVICIRPFIGMIVNVACPTGI